MSHLFISMSGPPCRRPSPSLKGAEPTRPLVSSNRAPRLRSTSLFMPGLEVMWGVGCPAPVLCVRRLAGDGRQSGSEFGQYSPRPGAWRYQATRGDLNTVEWRIIIQCDTSTVQF